MLNGLGTCYYEGSHKNRAIHTDICSPLATSPTWPGLKPEQKNVLSKDGFDLWNNHSSITGISFSVSSGASKHKKPPLKASFKSN